MLQDVTSNFIPLWIILCNIFPVWLLSRSISTRSSYSLYNQTTCPLSGIYFAAQPFTWHLYLTITQLQFWLWLWLEICGGSALSQHTLGIFFFLHNPFNSFMCLNISQLQFQIIEAQDLSQLHSLLLDIKEPCKKRKEGSKVNFSKWLWKSFSKLSIVWIMEPAHLIVTSDVC